MAWVRRPWRSQTVITHIIGGQFLALVVMIDVPVWPLAVSPCRSIAAALRRTAIEVVPEPLTTRITLSRGSAQLT